MASTSQTPIVELASKEPKKLCLSAAAIRAWLTSGFNIAIINKSFSKPKLDLNTFKLVLGSLGRSRLGMLHFAVTSTES